MSDLFDAFSSLLHTEQSQGSALTMLRFIGGQPTATIEDIPDELLDRLCAFSESTALKALRLTSKALNAS
ncbi:hypothetical protein AC578_8812 [Pseudocercospora eumusae]|uniref:F-box domain-containing protein n=1 Tax=Pseudocercospora eumusae TaxID=321146 RepID=A0A139GZA1_9PEZI|nr:hypothetical protein AC578_8812 [Pseudocercospora eumusae]